MTTVTVNEEMVVVTVQDGGTIVTVQDETPVFAVQEEAITVLTVAEQGPRGPQGPQGPAGAATSAEGIIFHYGDVSPILGITVEADKMVMECLLIIETPFDGVGAALSIGDSVNHQSLLATNQVNPAIAGGYYSVPLVTYAAATALNLYITPGTDPHQGSGKLFIFVEG